MVDLRARGRLGHAYTLIQADVSANKELAARIIAALFCPQTSPTGQACGICADCVQLRTGNHPGVTWLEPDGATLKIAQMRTAWKQDMRKTSGSADSVIVLNEVHRLTTEATNAILKWVEEPHEGRLFLFLTRNPSALLPTLRSRSVPVRVVEKAVNMGIGTRQLSMKFGFSGTLDRFAEMMNMVLELGETCVKRRDDAWCLISDRLAKFNFSQEEMLVLVDLLVAWFRDVAALACGSSPIVYEDVRERLETVCRLASAKSFAEQGLAAAKLRRRLHSHVNAALAMESLMIDLVGALH